jgi:general secretion pathway protein A
MYHNFFGLSEQAFSIAVNPRYLYMSNQHREALAHLVYGIQVGGFVLLTGEVGTGKTTIIRCLLEQLPETTDIAIVLNPMASAPELLGIICDELGVNYVEDRATTKDLIDALHKYLLTSHEKGRKTVLLIDEAQLLKPAVLEQIRLLTNLETTTEKLLQIILVGQPELKKLLARPSLRQLSQRITARFHLEALSLAETRAYIAHRLGIAGMPAHQNPFPPAIIKKVHEFSGGVPRLINVLCERMLLGAYGKNQSVIDNTVFRQAATEVSGELPPSPWANLALPRWHLGLVVGLMVLLLASFLLGRNTGTGEFLSAAQRQAPVVSLEQPIAESSASSNSASSDIVVAETPAVDAPIATAETPVVAASVIWERDFNNAQQNLFKYLELSAADSACLPRAIYACERTQLSTWDELKDINRPAILGSVTGDKKLAYTILVGLNEEQALVLLDDQIQAVDWQTLASSWNGSVFYLWRRPPGFEAPLAPGNKGDAVIWLAQQFARLDNQETPLTRNIYNEAMRKRIEIFQTQHQLEADGIAGGQTLRRLNEALGIDKLLMDVSADLPDLPDVGVE